jgi:hypothetical protein
MSTAVGSGGRIVDQRVDIPRHGAEPDHRIGMTSWANLRHLVDEVAGDGLDNQMLRAATYRRIWSMIASASPWRSAAVAPPCVTVRIPTRQWCGPT